VRVAALYDIHGNDAALAAVLAEVEALDVDLIVVGGDVAGGPFPRQSVDEVRALGDRAIVIRGNGERELVEARLRLDAGSARIDPDDVWSSRTHWAAGALDQERLDWMAALPPLASIDVDGLGDVLFCHASPRNDEEIVTPLSPEERILPMLAGVAQRTVVLGHTHVQFDREVAGRRLVNAGSVGLPYEGRTGAFWALLGPGVELRRTRYDVTVTCARVRESGIPDAEEYAEGLAHPPPAAEANEFFERMATRSA
jgi:predicted phosphodiesterase